MFLIRNVSREKYGGGESYQIELAKQMLKHHIRPIIFTASDKLIQVARENEIEVVRAPFFKIQNLSGIRNILLPIYYIWQEWAFWWYKKQIRRFRPVTLNIQSRDEWIAASRAGLKMGVRVIWTDHIDFRTWVLMNVNVKYKNVIGKIILKYGEKVDKIIMISDFERKNFDKVTNNKFRNVVTIKNGVIDEYKKYKKIEVDEKGICYVGRIVDYKGINELILAFKKIRDDFPDARLKIYGDGEDFKKYQKIVSAEERIKMYGYTNEPLMAMAENRIFVLPSYYEGLSLSLIDAAMMGRTIVATNVDGNPEVVEMGKTGMLVPVKSVDKLAEALKEILENAELRRELARGARINYEKNFNFDKIFVEEMILLYNKEKEKK